MNQHRRTATATTVTNLDHHLQGPQIGFSLDHGAYQGVGQSQMPHNPFNLLTNHFHGSVTNHIYVYQGAQRHHIHHQLDSYHPNVEEQNRMAMQNEHYAVAPLSPNVPFTLTSDIQNLLFPDQTMTVNNGSNGNTTMAAGPAKKPRAPRKKPAPKNADLTQPPPLTPAPPTTPALFTSPPAPSNVLESLGLRPKSPSRN